MTTLRMLLGIVGGAAAGYALAALFLLGDKDFGVAVAISAACVLGIYLIRAVQDDRRRHRARMGAYRDAVWQRRIRESRIEQRRAS
jgi:hypothetical protein